jgi:hypothetical protein
MTEQSSGNVCADLELPYPNARLFLAKMRAHWNKTLTEKVPDDLKQFLDRL